MHHTQVHDENLLSIQLLNQYMDEQRVYAHSYGRERKRVFFSAYVPVVGVSQQPTLKRFRLDLAANIEDNMKRILRECGVDITSTDQADSHTTREEPSSGARGRDTWDFDSAQYRASGGSATPSASNGGMDYGFNAHFAQYMHVRRRKRPIVTLREFLVYMDEPATQQKQEQTYHAWESIQSVKRTLAREFGLREVSTSCGWASVPLNATLMSLLKTLRKLNGAVTLDGVRLDVRADASEIDYFDEYTVVLNVADVPNQWVEVLEKVDAEMHKAIHAAYTSLQQLQHAAEQALGGTVSITRGRTCSAIAYRGFLQDVAVTAPLYAHDPMRSDSYNNIDDAIMEKLHVTVEDAARECEILEDGRVRVPSCSSATDVLDFLDAHRSSIRDQYSEHETLRRQFELLSKQCITVFGLLSLTYSDNGPRLSSVNRACTKLLKFASDNHPQTGSRVAELLQSTRGRHLRIDRYFGLAQDGVFTVPVEW